MDPHHEQAPDAPTPLTPPTEPGSSDLGPTRSSGLATASMVLGIFGVITSCILVGLFLGIAALVTGIIAIGQIDNPANRYHGRGNATAGAILGGSAILLGLILPLMIGILLPALGAARRTAQQMQNNTQVRGIHQAMVIYSQANKTRYPGLTGLDEITEDGPTTTGDSGPGTAPAARFWMLMDNNYFTPDYAISPSETLNPWTGGPVTPNNYSYAMLEINDPNGGRRSEWRDTLNTQAPVLSDRNTGTPGNPTGYMSVHTDTPGDWRGSVAFNDNHVVFETSPILIDTKYGRGATNPSDDLFRTPGSDDAMMIHDE